MGATSRDFLLGDDPALVLAADAPALDPAPPRAAATVMLVRDDEGPLEVFMLRRTSTMAFAPSRHVFPGGGVDPRDASETPWAGPAPQEWAERLGTDEAHARMLLAAAVREVFEETGVLLASSATDPDAEPVVLPPTEADRLRAALVAKEVSLGEVLLERHLVLRSDLLSARGRWVTPTFERRRYDTWFFLAALPAGQVPDGATSEATSSGWERPATLLDEHARGGSALMPPTVVMLESLAAVSTVAEACDTRVDVEVVEPTLVLTDAGPAIRVEEP